LANLLLSLHDWKRSAMEDGLVVSQTPSHDSAEAIGSFDYQPRPRLVFGAGTVNRAGELARELGANNVLLVTDRGLVAAGHAQSVQGHLQSAGLKVTIFDHAAENPTTVCVDKCLKIAQAAGIDTIVGLGGGSSMDTAKGCNFLLTNGGAMRDYWGVGKAKKPMLPMIAIPTTAGTGSECQSAALIADAKTHQKMACLDPKAVPRIAILDPALTLTQPFRVTACTGMDALAHALETAVTKNRNPISMMFSREAFRLCITALPQVLKYADDVSARGQMLLGAALAGMAIENSMLGAAHAAANPLTAKYGVVHGKAVGLMLPAVIRYNSSSATARNTYAGFAGELTLNGSVPAHNGRPDADLLVSRVRELLDLAKLPRSLKDCGVESRSIPVLAEAAATQWTAAFNPRPLSTKDFELIYRDAYEG
jgi:alcohol dehydrogenase